MRYAALAVVCLIGLTEPSVAAPSHDRFFDGDRYRSPEEARPARKARVVHRRKPPARRVVVASRPKPALKPDNYPVIIAPLDAPERSPAMILLGRFVGEVLAAFGSIDVAARIPNPARDEVFARPPVFDRPRTIAGYLGEFRPLKSLAGFPMPLQKMVATLQSECGARVTSAYRPGARVAGSGRPSLHSVKKAVDMQGNPKCLYATLKKVRYAGGYSTDYRAVNHLHMSWGGREHGRRFAHYGVPRRPYRIRVASR